MSIYYPILAGNPHSAILVLHIFSHFPTFYNIFQHVPIGLSSTAAVPIHWFPSSAAYAAGHQR